MKQPEPTGDIADELGQQVVQAPAAARAECRPLSAAWAQVRP
jgi:hypothetical protein